MYPTVVEAPPISRVQRGSSAPHEDRARHESLEMPLRAQKAFPVGKIFGGHNEIAALGPIGCGEAFRREATDPCVSGARPEELAVLSE
jgi:hypothetical protein